MRRRTVWIIGASALIGLLGVGLVLREDARPKRSDAMPQATHTSVSRLERAQGVPTPPPSGDLRIRGTVRDENGPVAGVRVSATRPMPGETLSELPCPATPGVEDDPSRRGMRLPDCLEEAGAQVLELVSAREGEAPVYAETVTAADGSFVLDGLPEGDFTLWALGARGAELRPGVKAGAQEVELVLNEGITLTGIVQDQDEQPLPGVELTILHEQHTRFFDTRSGGDGRFRIGPLPKGRYGLVAASEGWLPEFLNHGYLDMLRGKVTLVRPSRIAGRVLLEGAPAPGAEVSVKARECQHFTEQVLKTNAEGRFALERIGPCTYELTAARDGLYAVTQLELEPLLKPPAEVVLNLGQAFLVEGTVRDDTRRPVAGATVTVRLDGEYLRPWKATTDAEGHYRLGPVEAGSYGFDVSASGYVDVSEPHALARDTGPVDLTLRRAFPVAGLVVDDEGQPVPDIRLFLAKSEESSGDSGPSDNTGSVHDFRFLRNDALLDATSSDEAGRFMLDAPHPGPWKIEVEDDGFLPQLVPVHAPAEGVRLVLHRGAMVVGTVTDARGAPQEQAAVTLWRAESEEGSIRSTQTDAQGHFSLSGLPAGRFVIEASLDSDGVESTASKPIELRNTEQLEVALRFEEGRSLSGIAVDGGGQPLADVLLHVDLPNAAIPRWRRNIVPVFSGEAGGRDVRTGPDGRFTLKHLGAEAYELSARREGYTFVPARALGGEPTINDTLLVRERTSEVRVVLERQGRILGRLIGPDGAPLRYFKVNGELRSGPAGTFEVPFEESGVQRLEFTAPELASVLRPVEVHAGVDVNLGDVRMGAGRRVTGRVLDAETGAPISKARVQPADMSLGAGERSQVSNAIVALTREDGTFELPQVEARPLTLSVRDSDHLEGLVALGASEESVTVRLETGARLETTVRDHEGKPVSAQVSLEQEDGTGWKMLSVRDGTLVSGGLAPGLYSARVLPSDSRAGRVFLPQQVRIPASGRVVLNLVERKAGATLVLRVEDDSARVDVLLLTGAEPPPVSKEALGRWLARGLISEQEGSEKTFRYLPPGHATALLVQTASPLRFHLEELELPAEGVVERVVRPRWQPFPEK